MTREPKVDSCAVRVACSRHGSWVLGLEARRLAFVLLLLTCAVVYLGAGIVGVTFLSDDIGLVSWGRHMVEEDFWQPFHSSRMGPSSTGPAYYRPLSILLHGVNYLVWGYDATGHHLVNLVTHLVCCILVYLLTRLLLAEHGADVSLQGAKTASSHHARVHRTALWSALLFALHPVHEMPVNWIACGGDLFCAALYLSGLICFVEYVRIRKPILLMAAATLCALALATKELGYTFPIVCLVLALALAEGEGPRDRVCFAAKATAPLVAIAAAFMAYRLFMMPLRGTTRAFSVDAGHVISVARLSARYLLLPYHVSFREIARENAVLLGVIGLVAASLVLVQVKRFLSPVVLLCGLCLFVTTAPFVSSMSPWILYIPSVAFCIAMAKVFEYEKSFRGVCGALALTLILASYAAQMQYRKQAWHAADTTARNVLKDYREFHQKTPCARPVFLTLPGAVSDIPVFMHCLELRMRMELGDEDIAPEILSFLVISASPAEQGVEVKRVEEGVWEIVPKSEQSYFALRNIRRGYHNPSYDGTGKAHVLSWGTIEIRGKNDRNSATSAVIRLSKEWSLSREPRFFYYSDGHLCIADNR